MSIGDRARRWAARRSVQPEGLMQRLRFAWSVPVFLAVAAAFGAALPATGQTPGAPADQPLPTEMVVINIDAPENEEFRVGIPDLLGAVPHRQSGTEVLRNDFLLMPGYRVIDPRSIRHDLAAEGLDMRPASWSALGANAVIKGSVTERDGRLELEMRLFVLARGHSAVLNKGYSIAADELRMAMHDFVNEALRELTGTPGPFGTRLTFAQRVGPGRKDVYLTDMDGFGTRRISDGTGIAMLPTFGYRHIWFTRLTPTGMFITHGRAHNRSIIGGDGLNMSPSICEGRMFFTSSRDGNSEIYSVNRDATDLRRLTNHPAIDVSPSCRSDGKIAFVSTRHGTPQVFTMDTNGGDVRRLTFRGSHNQTPAFCPDPRKPLVAFTGRDGGLDIFVVNTVTQEYTRLTQGQGSNKDPAFSPDCRMVAFVSDRRGAPGIYLSSVKGFNQNRIYTGAAETVRWSRTVPTVGGTAR